MAGKMSIAELKKQLELCLPEELLQWEEVLKKDERIGVQKIGFSLEKKRMRAEKERQRILQMKEQENSLRQKGYLYVGGVDEAGRGPLAGPVVAACVVMKENSLLTGINDSKKIREEVREALYDKILEESISFGIGLASNEEIDRYNILQATFLAMKRAIMQMKDKPDYLLIDGNQTLPEITTVQESVVHGDGICYSIACASILAKVYRDRIMREYNKIYPEFEFVRNKGYATDGHYEALRRWGVTPIHRRSFLSSVHHK